MESTIVQFLQSNKASSVAYTADAPPAGYLWSAGHYLGSFVFAAPEEAGREVACKYHFPVSEALFKELQRTCRKPVRERIRDSFFDSPELELAAADCWMRERQRAEWVHDSEEFKPGEPEWCLKRRGLGDGERPIQWALKLTAEDEEFGELADKLAEHKQAEAAVVEQELGEHWIGSADTIRYYFRRDRTMWVDLAEIYMPCPTDRDSWFTCYLAVGTMVADPERIHAFADKHALELTAEQPYPASILLRGADKLDDEEQLDGDLPDWWPDHQLPL